MHMPVTVCKQIGIAIRIFIHFQIRKYMDGTSYQEKEDENAN